MSFCVGLVLGQVIDWEIPNPSSGFLGSFFSSEDAHVCNTILDKNWDLKQVNDSSCSVLCW